MSDLWLLISNNVPEFILLVVGTLLIAVEIFLPGFGIPGIAGIIAMAAGLILMDPTLPQAVILLLCAGSVLGILGNKKLDVVSDGEFIPAGTPVKVDETDGNRVVVRASGN